MTAGLPQCRSSHAGTAEAGFRKTRKRVLDQRLLISLKKFGVVLPKYGRATPGSLYFIPRAEIRLQNQGGSL
jgi:hypothetical protein